MKKLIIQEEKLGEVSYWDVLFKTKEDDFKKLKKQSKRDILTEAYKKAPDTIRLDKEWVMKAVTDFHISFSFVDESIKDKAYCMRYVEEYDYPSTYAIPEQYQEELFEKLVLKNPFNMHDLWYKNTLSHLKTKENIYKWVALNANIYKELEKTTLKNDFAVAEIAAIKDPQLLFKMNKSIARRVVARNIDLALSLFEENKKVFPLLPLKIRNDRYFILKNVADLNYDNAKYIGKEALQYKEVILGMKTFYDVTIPEELLTDREVAYHIISSQNYLSSNLKDCASFTLIELIKQHLLEKKYIHFYKNLPDSYRDNPEVISAFLEIGYFKEGRKVKKLSSYTMYEFEETEYFDTSVVKLLPDHVQKSLIEEYQQVIEEKKIPEESELLSFARNKYLQMNLIEKFDDKFKVKKMKI